MRMRKIFIVGIISALAIIPMACSGDTTKSERCIEGVQAMESSNLEEKIGLEKMDDTIYSELKYIDNYPNSEYYEYRKSKIKANLLTEEIIDQCADRAQLIANTHFTDTSNYIYMKHINLVDSLGYHISDDVALNLLQRCIDFGNVADLKTKVKNNDEGLYWYNYTVSLLTDYYRKPDVKSTEETELVLKFLLQAETFAEIEVLQRNKDVPKSADDALQQKYENVKSFLESKKYN